MKIILLSFLFLISFWVNAFAYLDPGTGSIIFQLIIAGITGSIAYIVFYYRKFKDFLKKIFKKKESKN